MKGKFMQKEIEYERTLMDNSRAVDWRQDFAQGEGDLKSAFHKEVSKS